jgi:predicted homoserine dehydrogenase-like protein
MTKEEAQQKMDEKLLAGIQAGVAAVEFLCEVTEALGLDPAKANIDAILARINELIQTEDDLRVQSQLLEEGDL